MRLLRKIKNIGRLTGGFLWYAVFATKLCFTTKTIIILKILSDGSAKSVKGEKKYA